MAKKRRVKIKTYELKIIDYSDECRGIAKFNNKTIFVRGALKDEKVLARCYKNTAKFEEADTLEVLIKSTDRIEHKCEFYGVCGGCSLQHLSVDNQIKLKFELVKNMFFRHNIVVNKWLKPLVGEHWGYRRKARLGVRFVFKKNKVIVGFRERKSSFLADMNSCEVLHPKIGKNLHLLAQCVEKLSIKSKVAQFEVAISEVDTVLILRNLADLTINDKNILRDYANKIGIKWYLQSSGIDTIKALDEDAILNYSHPKHNIIIDFLASDFTQINFELNQKMVNLVIDLLQLKIEDKVLDLFCGLGNFTLAIARYVKSIIGVDFDSDLIQRAKQNAKNNNLKNIQFFKADLLSKVDGLLWVRKQKYNKVLIDPARSGALEVIELLPNFDVQKLVYVSCNPATLVRDSKRLTELGYKLEIATTIDMFPQTSHVETIVLFTK